MSSDSDRCYELLGVRPGVSRQELKAAYRDLTKVWHPDRFAHDPRLQEKAQDKLKEINDAYEQIVSGKPRRTRQAAQQQRVHRNWVRDYSQPGGSYSPAVVVPSRSLAWLLLPLIVFGGVFVVTNRYLQNRNNQVNSAIEQPAVNADVSTTEAATNDDGSSRRSDKNAITDARPVDPDTAATRELATTTVMIDSATGLLARGECPTRIRMTYPSGNEPRTYCTVHMQATATSPQHQSKLKSLDRKNPSSGGFEESDKATPEAKP